MAAIPRAWVDEVIVAYNGSTDRRPDIVIRIVRNREIRQEMTTNVGMNVGMKQKAESLNSAKCLIILNEPCRARTCDPLVKSQLQEF